LYECHFVIHIFFKDVLFDLDWKTMYET